MVEGYQTFDLVWADRSVSVSYQANWLNSGQWHVELRCSDRLPVTETGYRSCFVPDAAFADEGAISAWITTSLDEAAKDPRWQRYLEDSRQLKLF